MARTKTPPEPLFKRAEVARMLGIGMRTVTRREAAKKYPPARRDMNGYRTYSVNEVLNLQLLTYGQTNPRVIAEMLYEKHWSDPKTVAQLLDAAMARRMGT
jgi:DNA-binding transcriptional MerR regulator